MTSSSDVKNRRSCAQFEFALNRRLVSKQFSDGGFLVIQVAEGQSLFRADLNAVGQLLFLDPFDAEIAFFHHPSFPGWVGGIDTADCRSRVTPVETS